MNIRILCVGKLKEKYWKDALAEYAKRLGAYCTFTVDEVKEDRDDDIEKEGKALLAKIGSSEYVISLEIEGKARSSEDLSAHLQQLIDRGAGGGKITFLIGGSGTVQGSPGPGGREPVLLGHDFPPPDDAGHPGGTDLPQLQDHARRDLSQVAKTVERNRQI